VTFDFGETRPWTHIWRCHTQGRYEARHSSTRLYAQRTDTRPACGIHGQSRYLLITRSTVDRNHRLQLAWQFACVTTWRLYVRHLLGGVNSSASCPRLRGSRARMDAYLHRVLNDCQHGTLGSHRPVSRLDLPDDLRVEPGARLGSTSLSHRETDTARIQWDSASAHIASAPVARP
jgi:hypothetical protein